MFSFYTLFTTPLLVLNYMASAPYIQKQLSQIVIESIKPWNQACTNAGGGIKCNDLSMSAYMTLSSIPNQAACSQQHIADEMIDLSKTLENLDMIRLAQLFVQQPLPTIHGLPLPYCQEQPRNIELQGLYSCQFEGSILNLKNRVREHECHHSAHNGNVHVPSPRGSCPALARPLPNGYLLHALTSNPFGASSPESPK